MLNAFPQSYLVDYGSLTACDNLRLRLWLEIVAKAMVLAMVLVTMVEDMALAGIIALFIFTVIAMATA